MARARSEAQSEFAIVRGGSLRPVENGVRGALTGFGELRGSHDLTPRYLNSSVRLRCDEAAASVGVSPTKFREWEADGRMPKGRKIDGVVLYDTQEVFDAWPRLRDGELPIKNPFDGVTA